MTWRARLCCVIHSTPVQRVESPSDVVDLAGGYGVGIGHAEVRHAV